MSIETGELIIDDHVAAEARRLADRHYPFIANSYEAGWAITFPDLPGATGDAETWNEIGPAAHEALIVFIETQLALGKAVPNPSVDTDFLAATAADHRRAAFGHNASERSDQIRTAEVAK